MNYWKASRSQLYGYPAIEHELTGELTIASKYGEIYTYSNELAAVLVRNHKVANKIAFMLGRQHFTPLKKGEETIFKVKNEMVPWLAKALNITRRRTKMLQYANL